MKALKYKEYFFTPMQAFERITKSLEDIQVFFSKWNSECLAKGE
jgi:hypothetical protein